MLKNTQKPSKTKTLFSLLFHCGGTHASTLRQLRRAGLCHAPLGWYRAGVPDTYPLCGSTYGGAAKAAGFATGLSSVMLCSQPCHSAGTDPASWPSRQSRSP